MYPTLLNTETIGWNRCAYLEREPQRTDIVAVKDPQDGGSVVKRIIAMPGESIFFNNGTVYVNGRRLDEPYLPSHTPTYAYEKNENELIVCGKNQYLRHGRQSQQQLRQPHLRPGSAPGHPWQSRRINSPTPPVPLNLIFDRACGNFPGITLSTMTAKPVDANNHQQTFRTRPTSFGRRTHFPRRSVVAFQSRNVRRHFGFAVVGEPHPRTIQG